ncbi:MAG: GldG family protein [Verrucomicrobia bacterium]|nr:GldG family protein [Verrucomicrobiota bacterium]
MNLNSKQGTAGITALLVIAIVVAVNFLVGGLGFLNARIDLTEDRLYTLSNGTRNILNGLNQDEPVTIRYYVSTEDRVMPPVLKSHARTVQDLLLEFQKASSGKVILEKLAPNPNSEDEDKAREDDLQGMTVNQEGDNIYLGMAIQSAGKKEVLPFLNPNEETALEYNISRAIQKVSKTSKTVVGVMSAMPIMGSPMYPYQRQKGQEPWILVQRLRMDYEVRDIPIGSASIDSDVNVLVVVHPGDITEGAEYAIDQYLLKGGKVIALVDPQSWIAQAYSGQPNPMTGQPGSQINPSSDLPNLFKSWGIAYNKTSVVADVNYKSVMQGRQNPTALRLPKDALNKADRVTADLQSMLMMGAGSFDLQKKDGIEYTTLVTSSEASEMIDNTAAEKLRSQNLENFTPSGKKQLLAVRLSGKFKTAFPSGKPKGPAAPKEGGGAQEDANAPKSAEAPAAAAPVTVTTPAISVTPAPATAPTATTPAVSVTPATAPATATNEAPKDAAPAAPTDGTIVESSNTEGSVILFADADMMYDAFCVQQDPMTGGLVATNSNLPLILNSVEILSGGGDLLQVRSRASTQRPFTKMDELREDVEKDFRPILAQKQAEMDKIAQEMGPLRVKNGQLADPNQIKKLEELMKKQTSINKDIRNIKKDQSKDIDKTQSIITILNVFGVPLLVITVGLMLAIRRRVATAAI